MTDQTKVKPSKTKQNGVKPSQTDEAENNPLAFEMPVPLTELNKWLTGCIEKERSIQQHVVIGIRVKGEYGMIKVLPE